MSTPYNGSDAFPISILLPDDGEPIEAAAQNVPLEGLADRTEWLRTRVARGEYTFTSPGSWVAPVTGFVIAHGYGGGGGGGGGAPGLNIDNAYAMAGAGGGGAMPQVAWFPVTAGESYTIDIGTPGAGGPASGTGNPGQATTVFRDSDSAVLCEFGGAGGGGGQDSRAASSFTAVHLGGMPYADFGEDDFIGPVNQTTHNPKQLSWQPADTMVVIWPLPPGAGGATMGGYSGTKPGRNGRSQLTRMRGGTGLGVYGYGGTAGADSSNRRGGGGGGGGGAGPEGSAGDGGNGGNGNNGGAAGNGTPGTNAAPNSGGGGGGGGAGGAGNGPAVNGEGGEGGNGGSGKLVFFVFGVQPP